MQVTKGKLVQFTERWPKLTKVNGREGNKKKLPKELGYYKQEGIYFESSKNRISGFVSSCQPLSYKAK